MKGFIKFFVSIFNSLKVRIGGVLDSLKDFCYIYPLRELFSESRSKTVGVFMTSLQLFSSF